MKADLEAMRKACSSCQERLPSQPMEKPKAPNMPAYPFQQIHSDYFHIGGKIYLLIVDAFTGWPLIWQAKRGGTAEELQASLRDAFTTYGIPERLTSARGPQYTAIETRQFLKSMGVTHRICSAYNPHSNMRAETGVKSMKRILQDSLVQGEGLEGEKAKMALLEYRNTPHRDLKLSPAQLLFGRRMRDLIQLDEGQWAVNKEYLLDATESEERHQAKMEREGVKWSEHTKDQKPLELGADVLVQCQQGKHSGAWNRSATVIQLSLIHI